MELPLSRRLQRPCRWYLSFTISISDHCSLWTIFFLIEFSAQTIDLAPPSPFYALHKPLGFYGPPASVLFSRGCEWEWNLAAGRLRSGQEKSHAASYSPQSRSTVCDGCRQMSWSLMWCCFPQRFRARRHTRSSGGDRLCTDCLRSQYEWVLGLGDSAVSTVQSQFCSHLRPCAELSAQTNISPSCARSQGKASSAFGSSFGAFSFDFSWFSSHLAVFAVVCLLKTQ